MRAKAIKNVLQQYESVLQDLEEMSKSKGESAVRAAGMLQKFLQGNTYLALHCAADVIELLETLNVSLQSRQKTMSGMQSAVNHVAALDNKRSDVHVNQLFDDAIVHVSKYDLEELKLPRERRPPTRFTGPAAAYQVPDVREYFKNE